MKDEVEILCDQLMDHVVAVVSASGVATASQLIHSISADSCIRSFSFFKIRFFSFRTSNGSCCNT